METFITPFYIFATLTLASSAMVVLSAHTLYSALFLVLAFFNASITIIMLGQDFLALLFMLIYVGAIMILFIFTIMMLDLKTVNTTHTNFYPYYLFTALLLITLFIEISYTISVDAYTTKPAYSATNWFEQLNYMSSISTYSCLYTTYNIYIVLAGLILLIAMIGAISLTLPFNTCNRNLTSNTFR